MAAAKPMKTKTARPRARNRHNLPLLVDRSRLEPLSASTKLSRRTDGLGLVVRAAQDSV
jgi:hypothetical protein